jgi:hypothetical protein
MKKLIFLLLKCNYFVSLLTSSEASRTGTNPFRNGCLKAMAEQNAGRDSDVFDARVCNSDDNLTGNLNCRTPTFEEYFEVRTASGDWDECKYSVIVEIAIYAAITQLPCTTQCLIVLYS